MTSQTHRTNVQIRFSDTDALGHINNAVFATWAEIARLDFLHALGTSVQSLILANLCIDFRRQVKAEDGIHVESWISRIGNSSMGMDQRIFANGDVAADVTSVVVHFDYAANRASTLPVALRERLGAFVRIG